MTSKRVYICDGCGYESECSSEFFSAMTIVGYDNEVYNDYYGDYLHFCSGECVDKYLKKQELHKK